MLVDKQTGLPGEKSCGSLFFKQNKTEKFRCSCLPHVTVPYFLFWSLKGPGREERFLLILKGWALTVSSEADFMCSSHSCHVADEVRNKPLCRPCLSLTHTHMWEMNSYSIMLQQLLPSEDVSFFNYRLQF